MGRPRKSAPKHVEPEDESQESPDEEPAAVIEPEAADDEGDHPNKSEAARQAIRAGCDKPATALPWIKEMFGIEMGATHFSAIKSQYLKAQAAKPAMRSPGPKAPPVEAFVAPPEELRSANGEPDVLLALEGVKALVEKFGVDKVRRMVDLIG